MLRFAPFIMYVCVAFSGGGCTGKKKAAAAPKPPPAPVAEKPGDPVDTPIPSLAISVRRPQDWKLQPLGDGKTQVDITAGAIKVNLFRRAAVTPLAEIKQQPAGSAEEKVEWFEALPDGAIWELAQLPPGGGAAFGWTIDAKRVHGASELECYGLLPDLTSKQLDEAAVRAICESVTDLAAAPDGGLDGGK